MIIAMLIRSLNFMAIFTLLSLLLYRHIIHTISYIKSRAVEVIKARITISKVRETSVPSYSFYEGTLLSEEA
jgi:hypothetical protein